MAVSASDVERLKRLSTGASSFPTLRKQGMIYVDKTAQIQALAAQRQKFLLVRPRRFGKSLLVSTFEALFREGTASFLGLALEKQWKATSLCRVVKLDFSLARSYQSFEEFQALFDGELLQGFQLAGFQFDAASSSSMLAQVTVWLQQQEPASVVLLIDEYDAPFVTVLDEAAMEERVCRTLAQFYGKMQACDSAFRFVFVTGILKPRHAELRDALTWLTDLTFDRDLATLTGFTKDEIAANYPASLRAAAVQQQCSEADVLDGLVENYGGYCFDDTGKATVCNPWSVLNFFTTPECGFESYWMDTGGSVSSLQPFLSTPELRNPARCGADCFAASLRETVDSAIGVLMQAGYFTIRAVRNGGFEIGCPNREVTTGMASLYGGMLLADRCVDEVGAGRLAEHLWQGDASGFAEDLERLLKAIDVAHYPVKGAQGLRDDLRVILLGTRFTPPLVVKEAAEVNGGAALTVDAGSKRWILAFRSIPGATSNAWREADRLVEAAHELVEKESQDPASQEREIVLMAMAVVAKTRRIASWMRTS